MAGAVEGHRPGRGVEVGDVLVLHAVQRQARHVHVVVGERHGEVRRVDEREGVDVRVRGAPRAAAVGQVVRRGAGVDDPGVGACAVPAVDVGVVARASGARWHQCVAGREVERGADDADRAHVEPGDVQAVRAAVEPHLPGAGVVVDDVLVGHGAEPGQGDPAAERGVEVRVVHPGVPVEVGAAGHVDRAGVPEPAGRGAVPAVDVRVVRRTAHAAGVGVAQGRVVEVGVRGRCGRGAAELVGTGVEAAQGRTHLVVDVQGRCREGGRGRLVGRNRLARRAEVAGGGVGAAAEVVVAELVGRCLDRHQRGVHEGGVLPPGGEADRDVVRRDHGRVGGAVGGTGRVGVVSRGLLHDRVRRLQGAGAVGDAEVPVVDGAVVAGHADAGHRVPGPGAGPVVPQDVVEQQGLAELRRAGRQGGLQLVAVRGGGDASRRRVAVRGHRGGRRQVLHDRVAVDPDVRGVVEADAAALVRRDVVDDGVVDDVHRVRAARAAGHEEPDAAAVVVGQVGLDLVAVDVDRAGAGGEGVRVGRQLAGDHDAAALVVGLVEVDPVVVDLAVRAAAVDADAAAVLHREVAADVVGGDLVVVRAGEDTDPAGEVRAGVVDDPVGGDPDVLVVLVGVRGRQVGRAEADGAVAAAVVLDDVVGDLQVARVGVGEDRTALRGDVGRQPGRATRLAVDVPREALLVAAADVEAVDRRLEPAGELPGPTGRGGGVLGGEDVDDLTVADVLVAVPGHPAELGVPVGGELGVAGERTAVDDRAGHEGVALEATGADALELDRRGHDQVLVVGAPRVEAWVARCRGTGVDDHEVVAVVGEAGVERPLDRGVGLAGSDLTDGRVVPRAEDVEGQAVDRVLAVVRGDLELVRPDRRAAGHGHVDVRVGPGGRGHDGAVERDRPAALAAAEAGAVDPERARAVHVGTRDREQLRDVAAERAGDRGELPGARPAHGGPDLGHGEVGRDGDARERLELGRDHAEPRVVVGVQRARDPGVVADEPVHPRAHAGRRRAADVVGRGQQHVVEAVVVGLDRGDEPVVEVVDPDRDERGAHLLAVRRGLDVGGEVDVVDDQAAQPRGQRHVGEDVEHRHDGLAVVERHELGVAPGLLGALVGRAAEVDEGRVVDRVGAVATEVGVGVAVGQLGEVALGVDALHVDGVVGTGTGRRGRLRDDVVAVADVDVLLAGDLVHRVTGAVVGDAEADEVVLGAECGELAAVADRCGRVAVVERPVEAAVAEPEVAVDRDAEVRGGRTPGRSHRARTARSGRRPGCTRRRSPGWWRARPRRRRGPARRRRGRGRCSRSGAPSSPRGRC